MIHKDIRYRRRQRTRSIERKSRIYKATRCLLGITPVLTPVKIGGFAKGKVHCSCPLCSAKTRRNMGVRDRSLKSWPIRDHRQLSNMIAQISEWEAS